MKWILIFIWLFSIVFFYFRGKIRPSFSKTFIDHSIVLAPINLLFVLTSKVQKTPFIPLENLPELQSLTKNWKIFRDEASILLEQNKILAAKKNDDVGFNSFFKYGWKRFYLKWYDAKHPSAEILCPKSVELLKSIPTVKAAMFAILPSGGKLNPHRDPYAGSLRYHLGLLTPNSDDCFILVDGEKYSWYDGEAVLFDETYIHQAKNNTAVDRIILFCDIERPLALKASSVINKFFSKHIMSAASSPNQSGDDTGKINKLTKGYWKLDSLRKKIKNKNKFLYKVTKLLIITLTIILIILI
ncbi:MAG: aspartyl beta-hydroxylase [Betaproteobacteria bacterium TMED41]|nr:MAG: aspartyl beta-hydroxylase [Betaproteobacteria bacterium TMED41]|tara:strand:+ start:2322 stop:3221 length:900 start_codon:yes stop_codon:yes gene_type:complete